MRGRRAALAVLALLAACAAPRDPEPAASVAEDDPGAPASLNDRFLAPDLQVDELVETFEGESREIARRRDAIVGALELAPGTRIADVGAGTGLFLGAFDAAVGPTGRVYAVDVSPSLIDFMRERAGKEGWTRVETVLCTERSVELPRSSIDLAFVCDTYHHFEHPRATLASLREALAPGGRLVIVEFDRVPGKSRPWVLEHVRADRATFAAEIESEGFEELGELAVAGLDENYVLAFRRP